MCTLTLNCTVSQWRTNLVDDDENPDNVARKGVRTRVESAWEKVERWRAVIPEHLRYGVRV
jgi:hypothetical protein